MKKCFLLLLTISLSSLFAEEIDIDQIDRMVEYNEADAYIKTFEIFKNSDSFITKFGLSKDEIKYIGFWTDNYTAKYEQTSQNASILSLDFFPNRIMSINLSIKYEGLHKRAIIYCLWKVDANNLKIAPLVVLIEPFNSAEITVEKYISIKQQEYKSIGLVESFDRGYVQLSRWNFKALNSDLIDLPFSLGVDIYRMRILEEYAFPSIYQRIGNDTNVSNLFLYPEINKNEYFFEIEKTHSWQYIPKIKF